MFYHLKLIVTLVISPVFFILILFAAAKPSTNVCVAHGTLCNDPCIYIIATTA